MMHISLSAMGGSLMLLALLLPAPLLALDAATQRLEEQALCQAMPYREECRDTPAPPQTPQPKRKATSPPAAKAQDGLPSTPRPAIQPSAPPPPSQAAQTPLTREDFIRGAGILCLAQLGYTAQSTIRSEAELGMLYACMRAYLAREGIKVP